MEEAHLISREEFVELLIRTMRVYRDSIEEMRSELNSTIQKFYDLQVDEANGYTIRFYRSEDSGYYTINLKGDIGFRR